VRDNAARAIAQAVEQNKNGAHPETLRYVVGLREGWEEALAAWRERAASGEPSQ